MPVAATLGLDMQFSGSAGAWTSASADVLQGISVRARYGILSADINSRVAGIGTLDFALNNGENNSAGKQGYYSPGHANARSNFDLGIGVRLTLNYSGSTYIKFIGRLASIRPEGGKYLSRRTHCQAMDWMDEAARHKMAVVATQTNQTGDQLISTIVGNMARVPSASSLDVGKSTFPYAGDNWQDERTTALQAIDTVAQSELGYVHVHGDTATGGVLRFENRHARPTTTTSSASFNDTMVQLSSSRTRQRIINRVRTQVYPRRVDAATATCTLFTLQNVPSIGPGACLIIVGQYTDPNQLAVRVGGASMITPASTTDYTFNSASDGSGTNMAASLAVSTSFGGNSVRYQLVNNSSALTGYLTLLKARGAGLYSYQPTLYDADNSDSASAYGLFARVVDMPLQSSPTVGQDVANYLLGAWKNPQNVIDQVKFLSNTSNATMLQALAREPGDRITIIETATGINNDYFINGVELVISYPNLAWVTWTVLPAATQNYWILGVSGFSELGSTTLLGY